MRLSPRLCLAFLLFTLPALGLDAQNVRVLLAVGAATIQSPDDEAPRPVVAGDVVPLDAVLVTGPGARLVLTPFPGITSMLAENSTLVLERAESGSTGDVNLQQTTLDLRSGALTSDLDKPADITYDYRVRTARGLAGARGTLYTVALDRASGAEATLVAEGAVQINFLDGPSIRLGAGKATILQPGTSSVTVSRISELSPANQAVLQRVMATMLDTVSDTLARGITLQGDALSLTRQLASDLASPSAPTTTTEAPTSPNAAPPTNSPTTRLPSEAPDSPELWNDPSPAPSAPEAGSQTGNRPSPGRHPIRR